MKKDNVENNPCVKIISDIYKGKLSHSQEEKKIEESISNPKAAVNFPEISILS